MLTTILRLTAVNVERTIKSILKMQANAEGEMAAIRHQQAKAQTEVAAIRTLIRTGMKMLVKQDDGMKELRAAQSELAEAQRDLAKAQKVTEVKLQSLLDALRRGSNGNHRKN